jgi:predicted phosphohydrolase
MRIQIYSDIHLEFYKNYPKIKKEADILFLAGDIGKINTTCYKDFFDYVSETWDQCFIVLGNHEYYHSSKTKETLDEEYNDFFSKYKNITLLNNSITEFNNYKIIGSTYWSKTSWINNLNDFVNIKDKNNKGWREGISLTKIHNFHDTDEQFLKKEIVSDKPIIVITHFPPTRNKTSHDKYQNQEQYLKEYFANEFDFSLIKQKCIWICGHTHHCFDINKENVRIIGNQFGYKEELPLVGFNIDGIFEI